MKENQKEILQKQEDLDERIEDAEKVTDPALKLASRIGNKVANALSYGFIIGFIAFLIWLSDKIGFTKLSKLFR